MTISELDFQRMQARLGGGMRTNPMLGTTHSSGACESERQLHEDILAECRRRGWIAFHGSMAHRSHRTVGEPDFLILLPNGRTLLLEAKSATGKLSAEQLAMQASATKLGHNYIVARSLDEFMKEAEKMK